MDIETIDKKIEYMAQEKLKEDLYIFMDSICLAMKNLTKIHCDNTDIKNKNTVEGRILNAVCTDFKFPSILLESRKEKIRNEAISTFDIIQKLNNQKEFTDPVEIKNSEEK